jgi:hypothetical protein
MVRIKAHGMIWFIALVNFNKQRGTFEARLFFFVPKMFNPPCQSTVVGTPYIVWQPLLWILLHGLDKEESEVMSDRSETAHGAVFVQQAPPKPNQAPIIRVFPQSGQASATWVSHAFVCGVENWIIQRLHLNWVKLSDVFWLKITEMSIFHSSPSSAEIKYAWSYTSNLPYAFIAWCGI